MGQDLTAKSASLDSGGLLRILIPNFSVPIVSAEEEEEEEALTTTSPWVWWPTLEIQGNLNFEMKMELEDECLDMVLAL